MSARPQVTITLGRSGQVVKRSRPISDGRHSDDDMPLSGGKRPVRERLESNMANSKSYGSQYESKRQRTEGHNSRFMDENLRDMQIKSNHQVVDRDDLRWKLLKRSTSRKRNLVAEGHSAVDLREKLSRSRRAYGSSVTNGRYDAKHHGTESSTSGFRRRIPSRRSADDLLELDSHRKAYSFRQRHSSPERLITSRHMSPSRRYGELQHSSLIRPLDTSRHSLFMNGGAGDASRSHKFMTEKTCVDSTNPCVRAPAPMTISQRSGHKPEEPLTVATLLHSLGLGKYAILFQAEEVDMAALRQMGDNDLKEMGIPMGPRKKILLAVLSHTRQRQRR